jgi:hypothetical protein
VTHYASPEFWQHYEALPPAVRTSADAAYALLAANPRHPSLHLKKVGPFWSARASKGYRALAREVDDGLLWFWIGPHSEYERFLST